jgi:transposase
MSTVRGFYIGVDVSKDSFSAAAAPEGMAPSAWRSLRARSFVSDEKGVEQFVAWLKALGGNVVCLCAEATGVYSWRLASVFAHKAQGAMPLLSIVNPRWPQGTAASLGVREKTDATDAAVLAVHALMHKPAPTPLLSAAMEELRELFRMREAVIQQSTATKNRIAAARTDVVRKELHKLLASLEKSIARIDKQIDKRIANDAAIAADFELLDSVPGIGRPLAIAILAEFGDLRQWKRSQIASYVGLFPRSHESGTSVRAKPRMAKRSNSHVRAKLFLGALASVAPRGLFKDFHKGLVKQGKAKMQSIGAIMRKLLVLARAVVISGKPFDRRAFEASQPQLPA